MIRYITRHGQVMDYRDQSTSHLYPPGDIPLSDLGREQARLLGERLKELGFHGRIISSPYMRTLQTSEIIAKITATKIVPYALMREIIQSQGHADNFVGMTLEEIREKIDCIDEEAELEYPWWHPPGIAARIESSPEVRARVRYGLELLELKYPDEELLLVGHGASAGSAVSILEIPKKKHVRTMNFNCALSAVDTSDRTRPTLYYDTSHLSYEITTSNYMTKEEYDAKYFDEEYEGEIELPEGISDIKGTKILHIGDTDSYYYPYYIKLIRTVRPDIIIHTGDTADEVKVGRIPGTRYEYLSKIRVLLDAMRDSGARIIIVPGNNDLPGEIHDILPEAEIYPVNTELVIDGVECRVGHQVSKMTFDKNWHFYGHGLTGEEWSYDKNVEGGHCRFNVSWGSFVYCLSEGKFFKIDLP